MAVLITPLPSPNFSPRPHGPTPSAIVVHTGEGSRQSDLAILRDNHVPLPKRVSSHYYVCRDGTIYQLVLDQYEAWHAGACDFLGITDWNGISLGIETQHRSGIDDWPIVQRNAITDLARTKISQHHIKAEMVVTHRIIASPPGRKKDPGDWPDAEFYAWVGGLYMPASVDYPALWGTAYPYFAESGIAVEWRRAAVTLGAATSDETKDAEGKIWRLFHNGAVAYNPATQKATSYFARATP